MEISDLTMGEMKEVQDFKEACVHGDILVLTLEMPEDSFDSAIEGRRKKWAAAIANIREDQVVIDWT